MLSNSTAASADLMHAAYNTTLRTYLPAAGLAQQPSCFRVQRCPRPGVVAGVWALLIIASFAHVSSKLCFLMHLGCVSVHACCCRDKCSMCKCMHSLVPAMVSTSS